MRTLTLCLLFYNLIVVLTNRSTAVRQVSFLQHVAQRSYRQKHKLRLFVVVYKPLVYNFRALRSPLFSILSTAPLFRQCSIMPAKQCYFPYLSSVFIRLGQTILYTLAARQSGFSRKYTLNQLKYPLMFVHYRIYVVNLECVERLIEHEVQRSLYLVVYSCGYFNQYVMVRFMLICFVEPVPKFQCQTTWHKEVIGTNTVNPRRACAARVTVVGLCVCVCLSVPANLQSQATRQPNSDANGLSATWRNCSVAEIERFLLTERTIMCVCVHFTCNPCACAFMPAQLWVRFYVQSAKGSTLQCFSFINVCCLRSCGCDNYVCLGIHSTPVYQISLLQDVVQGSYW